MVNKTPRVLVVDDELDLLDLYARRLKRAGFEVITAINGAEAIDFLSKDHCDIIVCDIHMPIKNGFDVFEFVRSLNEKLPFVFVTGHGEGTPETKTALSLGADGVFSKPVVGKILVAHLQKLCGIEPISE